MAEIRYFKICTTSRTRDEILVLIENIKAIINELQTTALRAVMQGDIAEYEIDTGQTKNVVKYTNQKTILESIEGYEKLLQMYQNKLVSRRVRLVDAKNFRR